MAGTERFTQRARRVLSLAHQEAERTHRIMIGPEHLLLGLMDDEGGVAGRVLQELGMTPERIREMVRQVTSASPDFDPNRVELASETQRTLEFAVEEARRLGHGYIGTEHILLGLVRFDNVGMEVLRRLGVTAEQIRRQTRRVLNEAASSHNVSSDEISKKLNQVFILHGQEEWKKTVAALVQSLGHVPVLLDNRNEGKTSIEYLDKYSGDIVLAVVILTDHDPEISNQVVFELGYFRGKLGRNRTCILYLGDLQDEVGSLFELTGIICVPLDAAGSWMMQFAKVIQDAELK